MTSLPLYQVDAFAEKPFTGNPAAVCLLQTAAASDWMQHVALEMNLSETAFLYPEKQGYNLRWFTPTVEVDLCGHATLASAHVLWESGRLANNQEAIFHTLSGQLKARCQGSWIEMDFPATFPVDAEPPAGLLQALGIDALTVRRSKFDYLVELATEEAVRRLQPDLARVQALGVRGVIVTSKSMSSDFDFVSRFFAPGSGIDEDPVTGSAHCALGCVGYFTHPPELQSFGQLFTEVHRAQTGQLPAAAVAIDNQKADP